MLNKFYEKGKRFIKENYKALLIYVGIFCIMTFPLPYYISTGGGTIDINNRVTVENQTKSEGTFNLAYVSELRATIPTFLMSYLFSTWERIPMSSIKLTETETSQDVAVRDKIYLSDANQNAISVAYQKAGKNFAIIDTHYLVVYLMEQATTDLKIGDIILSVEGTKKPDMEELKQIISNKNVGDKVSFEVKRDGKQQTCFIEVKEVDGNKIGGISMLKELEYETSPHLTLSFAENESGPSGGLLLSLSIYDKLVEEDLTKGRKIVGTGTIDMDGNIGSIGGVRYKLKGAVQAKADVFLVPLGENYEECIALQEKYHYNIKIIGVATFDEAVNALQQS